LWGGDRGGGDGGGLEEQSLCFATFTFACMGAAATPAPNPAPQGGGECLINRDFAVDASGWG